MSDLRQVVNFHVRAAGSRVGMFDGYGPVMPEPKPIEIKEQETPMRAPLKARLSNNQFIREQYPELIREDERWQQKLERMAIAPYRVVGPIQREDGYRGDRPTKLESRFHPLVG